MDENNDLPDVPLENCMLCWNHNTKEADVMKHPTSVEEWQRRGFISDIGASLGSYANLSSEKKVNALLTAALHIIHDYQIDVGAVYKALHRVPEVRQAFKDGNLC